MGKLKLSKNAEKKDKNRVANNFDKREYPRSYRVDSDLMGVLKGTLNRINKIAPKKVSEARLIKALILISREIEDEKMIRALKEIW